MVAVSNAIRRARAGLQDPNRPIGSFLFLGPTGVGKTELTKALAEFLFDDESAMVRIDMSEYMEKHSVARLIGAPPGYVGYDEGGALTEAVRRRPYQVILFDEVEKAHPDVFNVLLQVLDDGRLTDGQGRTVDFRNTLIVLTSNLGSEALANLPDGADIEQARPQVMEAVRAAFRPEFLNRLDEILLFRRLSRDDMNGIVEIQLRRLQKLLADRKITLDLDAGGEGVAGRQAGYDPVYGARPLKRVIQRELQNPLAQQILEGRDPGRLHGPRHRQPARAGDRRGRPGRRWRRSNARPVTKRKARVSARAFLLLRCPVRSDPRAPEPFSRSAGARYYAADRRLPLPRACGPTRRSGDRRREGAGARRAGCARASRSPLRVRRASSGPGSSRPDTLQHGVVAVVKPGPGSRRAAQPGRPRPRPPAPPPARRAAPAAGARSPTAARAAPLAPSCCSGRRIARSGPGRSVVKRSASALLSSGMMPSFAGASSSASQKGRGLCRPGFGGRAPACPARSPCGCGSAGTAGRRDGRPGRAASRRARHAGRPGSPARPSARARAGSGYGSAPPPRRPRARPAPHRPSPP